MDPRHLDATTTVIVPARPGPIVPLGDLGDGRDDVDDRRDDAFGAPDDGGAGPLDAVLLLAGGGVIVAGLTDLVPTWMLACGAGAFVLGALLPLRTFWRRAARARRTARLRAAVGDGSLLRCDDPSVARLVAAHDRCLANAAGIVTWRRVQVDAVAHGALLEVATLLAGRAPVLASQVADVTARTMALEHLADALADPTTGAAASAGPGARAELEPVAGGSAVVAAEALVRDLRDPG